MNPAVPLTPARLTRAACLGSLLVHLGVVVLLSLGMARAPARRLPELQTFDLRTITFRPRVAPVSPPTAIAQPAPRPPVHPSPPPRVAPKPIPKMPQPVIRPAARVATAPAAPLSRQPIAPPPRPPAARQPGQLLPAPSRSVAEPTPGPIAEPVAPGPGSRPAGGGGLHLGPPVAGGTIADPGAGYASAGTPGAGVGSGTGSGSGSGTGSGSGSGSGAGSGHGPASQPPPPAPPRDQSAPAPKADPAPAKLADRANPEVISKVQPLYPPECQEEGVEGTVTLQVEVLDSGRVGKVSVTRSSGDRRLDAAAVAAVRGWRYRPAVQGGIARTVTTRASVTFSLH